MRAKGYTLTKSRLMAWRQCPRKLWLHTHRPELAEVSAASQAVMDSGTRFGEVARSLYGSGEVLDIRKGAEQCIRRTEQLMTEGATHIFEAAFLTDETLVLVDVLERTTAAPPHRYRIVEVKASTAVKQPYLEDAAIQAHVVAECTGFLPTVSIGLVNNQFVYAGGGNYAGLLTEGSVDEEIADTLPAVGGWITSAKGVISGAEPLIGIGAHCAKPYACPFFSHCDDRAPTPYPVASLPRAGALTEKLRAEGYEDLRDVPADRLANQTHQRIHQAILSQSASLNPAAAVALTPLGWPRYYLDFETIAFTVPIWVGTRPFQQLPFQWSLHVETADGQLKHFEFLDLSGDPPMRQAMLRLLEDIGTLGPVFVYSPFEKRVLADMADRFPDLATQLHALVSRLYDLLPLTRENYYHPEMMGSWSIKKVLPTIAPELRYEQLAVANGGAAQAAYLEAIEAATSETQRGQLRIDMLKYCKQDTVAMVRLRLFLAGKSIAAN